MLGYAFYILGLAACLALAYFVGTRFHPAGALLVLPLVAWFIARLLVESGAVTWNFLTRGMMAKWDGRYYAFEGRQLRPVELEEGLAFLERDILAAIDLDESKTVQIFGAKERLADPDTGDALLTRAGCERLLLKSPHPQAKKLLLWLQRDVFGPYEKRRK